MNIVRFDFKLDTGDFNKLKKTFEPYAERRYLNLEFTLVEKVYDVICRIECTIIRIANRVEITLLMDCYLNDDLLKSGEFTLKSMKDLKRCFLIDCDDDIFYLINFNLSEIKTRKQALEAYKNMVYQLSQHKGYFKNILYTKTIDSNIDGMLFLLAGIETLSDEKAEKKVLQNIAKDILSKFKMFDIDEDYIVSLKADMNDSLNSEDYYNKAITYLYIKCLRLTTRRSRFEVNYDLIHDGFTSLLPNEDLFNKYITNLKKVSKS